MRSSFFLFLNPSFSKNVFDSIVLNLSGSSGSYSNSFIVSFSCFLLTWSVSGFSSSKIQKDKLSLESKSDAKVKLKHPYYLFCYDFYALLSNLIDLAWLFAFSQSQQSACWHLLQGWHLLGKVQWTYFKSTWSFRDSLPSFDARFLGLKYEFVFVACTTFLLPDRFPVFFRSSMGFWTSIVI